MDPEQDRQKHELASELFKKGKEEEAFKKYLELAESGSVRAQTLVGWLYYRGRGVTQDREKARGWLEKAADSGSAVALFYLGGFYRGVKQFREGREYLERAAEQEYGPAFYHLSIMHEQGEGVAVDKTKAQYYLQKAATAGNLKANIDVAMSLIHGHRGIWRVPQGVMLLARALLMGIKLGWTDPDSDRIRW